MSDTSKIRLGNGNWFVKEGKLLSYEEYIGSDGGTLYKPIQFDVTRATSATRINENGLIELVGNNVPRIDFSNDINGELLIEPQRTNNVRMSPNNYLGGVSTGKVVTGTGILQNFDVMQVTSTRVSGSSAPLRFNMINDVIGGSEIYIQLYYRTSATNLNEIEIDISDDDRIREFSPITDNEWHLFHGTAIARADYPNNNHFVDVAFEGLQKGDVVEYLLCVTEGNYKTSFIIPETSSAATRNADVLICDNLSTILAQRGGTLFFNVSLLEDNDSQKSFSLSQGSSITNLVMFEWRNSRQARFIVNVGGIAQTSDLFSSAYTANIPTKVGIRYSENDFALYLNGTQKILDNSGSTTFTGNLDTIEFNDGTTDNFYGRVKSINIYNTPYDNTELTDLTIYPAKLTNEVSVAGAPFVGYDLISTNGSVEGENVTTTYQWEISTNGSSSWSDISGATSSSYTIVSSDENKYIRVVKSVSNVNGSDESISSPTSQIKLEPFNSKFGIPVGAFSLRDLNGDNSDLILVRRSSDDTELSFNETEINDGTLTNWVNTEYVLFDEDFSTDVGWSFTTGVSITGGKLVFNNVGNTSTAAFEGYGAVPYQTVRITVTISDYVSGGVYITNFGGGGSTSPIINSNGTFVRELTLANGNQNWGFWALTGPTTLKIDNFKVEVLTATGYVPTWYNQGFGNDVVQPTETKQPIIVNAGTLVTKNSKPAILWDGVDDVLRGDYLDGGDVNDGNSAIVSVSSCSDVSGSVSRTVVHVGGSSNGNMIIQTYNNGVSKDAKYNGSYIFNPSISSSNNVQYLRFLDYDGTNFDPYLNNTIYNTTDNPSADVTGQVITIGGGGSQNNHFFIGEIQEVIIYDFNKSGERTDIQDDINTNYSIY